MNTSNFNFLIEKSFDDSYSDSKTITEAQINNKAQTNKLIESDIKINLSEKDQNI
jgi:hypothetical protein